MATEPRSTTAPCVDGELMPQRQVLEDEIAAGADRSEECCDKQTEVEHRRASRGSPILCYLRTELHRSGFAVPRGREFGLSHPTCTRATGSSKWVSAKMGTLALARKVIRRGPLKRAWLRPVSREPFSCGAGQAVCPMPGRSLGAPQPATRRWATPAPTARPRGHGPPPSARLRARCRACARSGPRAHTRPTSTPPLRSS